MAILRSLDGKFYEIPDDQLSKFEVAPEDLPEEASSEPGAGDRGPISVRRGRGPAGTQIVINIGGGGPGGEPDVQGRGGCGWSDWRNWQNCS